MDFETLRNQARLGRYKKSYIRFLPRRAIQILISRPVEHQLERSWALMSLLFWAFFDPRTRDNGKLTPFHTDDARCGGNLLLLHELHISIDHGNHLRFNRAIEMMLRTEGFANAMLGFPVSTMYNQYSEFQERINYVLTILRFLIVQHSQNGEKATLQQAKKFAAALFEDKYQQGKDTIQKFWEEYAPNAALLFAFSQEESIGEELFSTVSGPIEWARETSSDVDSIARIFGRAASCSKILAEIARSTRKRDFDNVTPVRLELPAFDVSEQKALAKSLVATPVNTRRFRPRLRVGG